MAKPQEVRATTQFSHQTQSPLVAARPCLQANTATLEGVNQPGPPCDAGHIVFKGSEADVAEAERVIKALQAATRSADPATIKQLYENAERDAANIAQQLRDATGAKQPDENHVADVRQLLHDAVQTAFDLRLQLQQFQLEQAEADLVTARARLIRRERISKQIIERRVQELETDDDLSWSTRSSAKPTRPTRYPLISDITDGASPKQTGENEVTSRRWEDVFGLRLGNAVVMDDTDARYRGGVRVESVGGGTPSQQGRHSAR
jgi:hypothetical protein